LKIMSYSENTRPRYTSSTPVCTRVSTLIFTPCAQNPVRKPPITIAGLV